MTTSSFDRNRCTRISPSAVLDDRLDGKDLEWARDHLRRCEACRDRVEDFREMLLRVGRLPSATIGAAALDQAFAVSIPQRLRGEAGTRSFEMAPAASIPAAPQLPERPTPRRPELSEIPDLLSELEREIFRDEPAMDHPTALSPIPEPMFPSMAGTPIERDTAPAVEPEAPEPEQVEEPVPLEPTAAAPSEAMSGPLRQVPVDSYREPEVAEWQYEPAPFVSASEAEPEPAAWHGVDAPVEEVAVTSQRSVGYDQDPGLHVDHHEEEAAPAAPRRPDNAMRITVGLGAAACVLLAAVLYQGGWLPKAAHKLSATSPAASVSIHPSPSIHLSASPSASPSAPPAPVLFTLGNGVSGNTVFRIRPGTAVAGYTRLVFDMHGTGLPTMVVTRPDDLHIAVTFKDTSVTGVPVNAIRSYQVAAIEPPVQQGPDGTITVDLARPVRVTAFTLGATGSYAWRLVLDLHTS